MTRWKIIIEYKGTEYSGWQRQKDGVPTIQQAIEEAIYSFCQQDITIHAAGRTDAGVHARGQVAHFDLDYGNRALDGYDLTKALNAHLRKSRINIITAMPVDDDFHARFSATNKLYTYRVLNRPSPSAIDEGLLWHYKKSLDIPAMQDACEVLLGNHDFSTFRDSQCQSKSPIKTLDKLWIETLEYDDHGGTELRFHTEALSFLHHQVRNMVGSLMMVGEGKWTKDDLKTALEAKDRTAGGPTAPSDGLYLVRIDYD